MHDEARKFTLFVKGILPDFFTNKKVLDIGSGDINGNNRFLFDACHYEGNDVIQAPNVTIVSKTGALPFADNTFDTVISTECFEHDPEYKSSWKKAYAMLKPGGLFCFTCASIKREEHGTRRTSPDCSYGTIGGLEDMSDYYKNLTEKDLHEVLDLSSSFSVWNTYYNSISCDLYFVGIKKAEDNMYKSPLPIYSENGVIETSAYINDLESLEAIYSKHDTDKNAAFHNYTRQYEALFEKYRNKPIKYLEIGVYKGGSIKASREAFKNAKCILGLDIQPECKKYEDLTNNIFIEIGDATTPDLIQKITEKYGTFDIILDDGSHINKDVIKTFELLFPLLNDNGLYIVEDTICYNKYGYVDPNYENHLQYFFKYTHHLNQWRHDSTKGVNDHCVDPFKIQKQTNNVFEYSIDKIEYGCSYIAISKKIRSHWK